MRSAEEVRAVEGPGELERLAKSFDRHLRAENKAEKTVDTYGESVGQLIRFLMSKRVCSVLDLGPRALVPPVLPADSPEHRPLMFLGQSHEPQRVHYGPQHRLYIAGRCARWGRLFGRGVPSGLCLAAFGMGVPGRGRT
jgi:hypothetical protein